ncbi:hypothetical protein [Niallia sp.]|uniref:hypothetical protein n=1 Tax=Niallia sp. TaxID=2837523 RepID=UPI0028963F98|nr:hypothetical protein [Niallia sp.]
MRRELLVALSAFFLMTLTAITGVYAMEKDEKTNKLIVEEKTDITNDDQEEVIQLKGDASDQPENSNFFKELFLNVTIRKDKTATLAVEGGFDPKLHIVDINDDHHKELVLTVSANERGSEKNFYFFQLQENNLVELQKPELASVESQFKDAYKAELKINKEKTYIFDLYDRRHHYEKLGLYHKGRLNEPTELILSPFSEIKMTRFNNQTAIKGKQKISGLAAVDTIGYLETWWTWNKQEWVLQKVKVKEISYKSS